MAAWTKEKRDAFEDGFYAFCDSVTINSKDLGAVQLGDVLYRGQKEVIGEILDGLCEDIHWVDLLKSRQLGMSTVLRALSVFWIGYHDGLKGYSIIDTAEHKEEGRLEILGMLEGLPARFDFPRIKRQNRGLIQLTNNSVLIFAAGGVRASKSSGVLGRSSGVNFCHVSEHCSIDNEEGIESFKNSLSEEFDNRLYLWESTGRGYNLRKDMWDEAKDDPHKLAIFKGWWCKDNQVIERDHPDWERYGEQPPTERERRKIAIVRETYGWQITAEQLAWVRRKMDPAAQIKTGEEVEFEGTALRIQEQAWDEVDAFQMPGAQFFLPDRLQMQANRYATQKYTSWQFHPGTDFVDMEVMRAKSPADVQFKVWDEPEADAVYIVSADPAYGHNEKNDRSAIQVLRAYADGCDQVAEFAWPLINTDQFAWVIMAIAAWYAGDASVVYLIVELNGPGDAVWRAIHKLPRQLNSPYFQQRASEKGLQDVFRNVRNFLYQRSDSLGGGRMLQWKTNANLKESILEELRAHTESFAIHIKSMATLARNDESGAERGDDRGYREQ